AARSETVPAPISRRFVLFTLASLPLVSNPLLRGVAAAQTADPLPSWNDGAPKRAILDFVAAVTRENAPSVVPQPERIASFDNDGTLWVEHPVYVQLAFALDRVKELAPEHPEWATQQPFKAAIEGDFATLAQSGERGLVELMMATHAGMTTSDFE